MTMPLPGLHLIKQGREDFSNNPWTGGVFLMTSMMSAWAMYFALVVVRVSLIHFAHPVTVIVRHSLTSVFGLLLTIGLYFFLKQFERAAIGKRVTAAVVGSVVPALLLSLLWSVLMQRNNPLLKVFSATMAENYFLFIAWATLYTAVSEANQFREAQRVALAAEAQARDAQLRALRYQLNPHFLFNALNSVSALIMRNDAERAEATVVQLSAFLRTTLDLDISADISLEDELRLQHLYLAIEQIRFGDRLSVVVKISDEVRSALVPSLILQPLVENVVRHAVSRTLLPVTLTISAKADDTSLVVCVADNADLDSHPSGGGHGLRNVVERLHMRFGAEAGCDYGPQCDRGFKAEIRVPLKHGMLS